MTVRTHVFTDEDGTQYLLCIFPDEHMTLAKRSSPTRASWGRPIREDLWYQDHQLRSVERHVKLNAKGAL